MTAKIDSNDVLMLFLGCFLGVLFTRLQFGEKNRRIFRSAAATILDEIGKADGNKLTQLYKDSVQSLRPEVSRVMEDIWRWNRPSFKAAWDKYCSVENFPLNMHYEVNSRSEAVAYLLPHFEEGRKQLEALLDEMIKNAK